MAPVYANIVMSILERNFLTGSCNKALVWLRYIDDIFAIWTLGEDKLKDFSFTLILSIPVLTLPVIILKNVFSFC